MNNVQGNKEKLGEERRGEGRVSCSHASIVCGIYLYVVCNGVDDPSCERETIGEEEKWGRMFEQALDGCAERLWVGRERSRKNMRNRETKYMTGKRMRETTSE